MKTKMFCTDIPFSKNKSIEIQLDIFPENNSTIFQFEFRIDQKTDHAGIGLFIFVYRLFYFHIQLYDHRHWNFEKKDWE